MLETLSFRAIFDATVDVRKRNLNCDTCDKTVLDLQDHFRSEKT